MSWAVARWISGRAKSSATTCTSRPTTASSGSGRPRASARWPLNPETLIGIEYKIEEPRTHQLIGDAAKAALLGEALRLPNVGAYLDFGHTLIAARSPGGNRGHADALQTAGGRPRQR